MKVQSYLIRMKENGNGILVVQQGTQEIEVCELKDIKGYDAKQLEDRALLELKLHDIEIVEYKEVFMQDQKIDLNIARNEVRKSLKELGDKNISLKDKKERLFIYEQTRDLAQTMVNLCKIELAVELATKGKK